MLFISRPLSGLRGSTNSKANWKGKLVKSRMPIILLATLLISTARAATSFAQGGTGRIESPERPAFTLRRQPRRAPRRSGTNQRGPDSSTGPAANPTNTNTAPVTSSPSSSTSAPNNAPPAVNSQANRLATINTADFNKGGLIASILTTDKARITQAITDFATAKGVDLLLDESVFSSMVLVTDDATDATDAFITAFNQTNGNAGNANVTVPPARIAVVASDIFGDQASGIRRLIAAYKQLDTEFQPRALELQQMQTRLNGLSGSSKDEAQKLLQQKTEQARQDYSNRLQQISWPIFDDINKALDRFARENGITAVLDLSKMASSIVDVDSKIDITSAFINAYNGSNSAVTMVVPRINVPDLKLGTIETGAFTDEKTGITRMISAGESVNSEFKPQKTQLEGLRKRIDALQLKLRQQQSTATARELQQIQDEMTGLEREFQRQREDAEAAFGRRINQLMQPVYDDISKALREFAQDRKITIVLDTDKTGAGIIVSSKQVNITREFVNEYNQRHP